MAAITYGIAAIGYALPTTGLGGVLRVGFMRVRVGATTKEDGDPVQYRALHRVNFMDLLATPTATTKITIEATVITDTISVPA